MLIEACCPADAHMVKMKPEHPVNLEEGEEDMSGTQFVCETVIRSLTLDAAPDHKPPQRKKSLQSECSSQLNSVALFNFVQLNTGTLKLVQHFNCFCFLY